jgi:adenosylcobyric acid synthase
VFASLVGTYELLEPHERNRFFGFLINKFRGDASLFTSGISYLEERLAQTCLGVIPYLHNHGIDDEDSVSLERRAVRPPLDRKGCLCVCVVGLPYLSNFTDFTALESVPNVVVYYTRRPDEASGADVLILPGSKSTIRDLLWLRENRWETIIESHVASGKPLVGICGGFQMIGRDISDPHHTESEIEFVPGLNLLDFSTVLEREKVTRQATARFANSSVPVFDEGEVSNPLFGGYEIHLGETLLGNGVHPLFQLQRLGDESAIEDGALSADGRILGTYLHGLFDSPEGLRMLLSYWRRICGKEESKTGFFDPLAERERHYDVLADHYRSNLKMDVIYSAINARQ